MELILFDYNHLEEMFHEITTPDPQRLMSLEVNRKQLLPLCSEHFFFFFFL